MCWTHERADVNGGAATCCGPDTSWAIQSWITLSTCHEDLRLLMVECFSYLGIEMETLGKWVREQVAQNASVFSAWCTRRWVTFCFHQKSFNSYPPKREAQMHMVSGLGILVLPFISKFTVLGPAGFKGKLIHEHSVSFLGSLQIPHFPQPSDNVSVKLHDSFLSLTVSIFHNPSVLDKLSSHVLATM